MLSQKIEKWNVETRKKSKHIKQQEPYCKKKRKSLPHQYVIDLHDFAILAKSARKF